MYVHTYVPFYVVDTQRWLCRSIKYIFEEHTNIFILQIT
jgi:hypothetical protein